MSRESEEIVIVTDGITDLLSLVRDGSGVVVVPCPVRIGRETYISSLVRDTQLASEQTLEVATPSYGEFLRLYQELGARNVISIHPPRTLHGVFHQARLARHLLYPQASKNVAIFEAKTVDTGVGFLVRVASQAARDPKGYEVGQILVTLNLLQTELIKTFLVTRSIRPLIGKLGLGRWDRLQSRVPGKEFLLEFDTSSSYFRLLARHSGFSYNLSQWEEYLETVQKPGQIRIRHQGFGQAVQLLRDQLTHAFQPKDIQVQMTSITRAPYPKEYVEVTFYPGEERIENTRDFAARVWKTYGDLSPETPFPT
jgi:fatty acid-binding protein DegV